MEKKTMGRFIAALRKANGLTQRELAERLCVSDKAVSRWERDETAPDLSLIPVIAEIFGVSSDELLRGERATPSPTYEERAAAKTEKQLLNLLRTRAAVFRIRSIAACGIALAGVLAAAICNFAFFRASLGFLVACVFFLAAAVCEAIFLVLAFSALGEDFDGEAVECRRKDFVVWGCRVFSLIAALVGGTLPLVILPSGPYMGLSGLTWPVCGTVSGLVMLAVAAAVSSAVKTRLSHVVPPELQRKRDRLKLLCAGGTAAVLLATLLIHSLLGSNYELYYNSSLSFDNYEDFKAYMAMELPGSDQTEPITYGPAAPVPNGPITYYDEYGNPTASREEAYTRRIVNSAREVVCEYQHYNEQVIGVRYEVTETCLPIRVTTLEQQRQAIETMNRVTDAFFILYPIEVAAGLVLYFIKRKKLQ